MLVRTPLAKTRVGGVGWVPCDTWLWRAAEWASLLEGWLLGTPTVRVAIKISCSYLANRDSLLL